MNRMLNFQKIGKYQKQVMDKRFTLIIIRKERNGNLQLRKKFSSYPMVNIEIFDRNHNLRSLSFQVLTSDLEKAGQNDVVFSTEYVRSFII